MARKRGNSEGSIYQRKDGTWRAQICLEGRRLSFSAKTRRDCSDWLKTTIGHIDRGLNYASTIITLGEYLQNWLAIAKTSMRTSTWAHYDQLVRNYVDPSLGKVKLQDLRPVSAGVVKVLKTGS
jgi:integrase